MISFFPGIAVAAGLLLGSFLNVCISRLPQHRSIAWPGSHCPRCGASIRPFDNVPLISFLVLRGRCRDCRGRISVRYPLVEVGLAILFWLAFVRFPFPAPFVEAAAFCFLLLGLLVMDAETFLLPDSFTFPGVALGLLQAALPQGSLIAALHFARGVPFSVPHWLPLTSSLAGASGAAGILLIFRWLYWFLRRREGMGLGDVKLAAMLGAWLGIAGVVLTLIVSFLVAAIAGLVLLRRARNQNGPLRLPFGSFLCAAGLVTLFLGNPLLRWYFSFWP